MADSVTPSVQTADLTEPQSTIPLTTAPHVVPASTSAIRVPIGLLSAPAASQSPASTSDIPMPPLITTLGVGYTHPPKPTHHTTPSASTARRLHIAAFAAQLVRIFVERASAPSIASVASAAGTRHRLLRDPRCLRRRARVAASLESTPAHMSST